jgi:hypothetical protein
VFVAAIPIAIAQLRGHSDAPHKRASEPPLRVVSSTTLITPGVLYIASLVPPNAPHHWWRRCSAAHTALCQSRCYKRKRADDSSPTCGLEFRAHIGASRACSKPLTPRTTGPALDAAPFHEPATSSRKLSSPIVNGSGVITSAARRGAREHICRLSASVASRCRVISRASSRSPCDAGIAFG